MNSLGWGPGFHFLVQAAFSEPFSSPQSHSSMLASGCQTTFDVGIESGESKRNMPCLAASPVEDLHSPSVLQEESYDLLAETSRWGSLPVVGIERVIRMVVPRSFPGEKGKAGEAGCFHLSLRATVTLLVWHV